MLTLEPQLWFLILKLATESVSAFCSTFSFCRRHVLSIVFFPQMKVCSVECQNSHCFVSLNYMCSLKWLDINDFWCHGGFSLFDFPTFGKQSLVAWFTSEQQKLEVTTWMYPVIISSSSDVRPFVSLLMFSLFVSPTDSLLSLTVPPSNIQTRAGRASSVRLLNSSVSQSSVSAHSVLKSCS